MAGHGPAADSLTDGGSTWSALGHHDYRRYWLGSLASVGGSQAQTIAQGWVVYELTGSALMLGYLGMATAIPSILMMLIGGVVADRYSRRRILIVICLLVTALLLLLCWLDASGELNAWIVIGIAGLISLTTGIEWPTRQSLYPQLIDRRNMVSAVALNSMIWQGTRMSVPALAGLAIAFGETWMVFLGAAAGYLAMVAVLLRLPSDQQQYVRSFPFDEFMEGLSFVFRERLFLYYFLLSYALMLLVVSHHQLMPAFADLLGLDERGYGYLMSATGVGSVLGTLLAPGMRRYLAIGWITVGGAFGTGISVLVFCLITLWIPGRDGFLPAMVTVFVAAVMQSVFLINALSVLQLRVPDALRGRVMGLHGITWNLMPLGALLVGYLTDWVILPLAMMFAIVVFLVIAVMAGTRLVTQEH
ncbi:MAG: MFS transporter [Gammaproteobacteria bacterium]|uniref:MFS transporter n=1 Tax=OM182 bacterium MED-G24 TaxID=1986255 RepID=A0A2A5WYP5_9GAMM|nr:MFS transporter [Gammaproteobacteria bacterium]PDH41680.1 MAG: MFS transporter [OM182 bacterium MED-G24]RPG26654.1 MAG: MFS transporter [Gammaproteobacteria bacterium TMED50]|tara:strand:- start:89 stop:1339 length:1251 start_codon:yes stop_codon:yes gene_type:complete